VLSALASVSAGCARCKFGMLAFSCLKGLGVATDCVTVCVFMLVAADSSPHKQGAIFCETIICVAILLFRHQTVMTGPTMNEQGEEQGHNRVSWGLGSLDKVGPYADKIKTLTTHLKEERPCQ
jgi:hypothetical protein